MHFYSVHCLHPSASIMVTHLCYCPKCGSSENSVFYALCIIMFTLRLFRFVLFPQTIQNGQWKHYQCFCLVWTLINITWMWWIYFTNTTACGGICEKRVSCHHLSYQEQSVTSYNKYFIWTVVKCLCIFCEDFYCDEYLICYLCGEWALLAFSRW